MYNIYKIRRNIKFSNHIYFVNFIQQITLTFYIPKSFPHNSFYIFFLRKGIQITTFCSKIEVTNNHLNIILENLTARLRITSFSCRKQLSLL